MDCTESVHNLVKCFTHRSRGPFGSVWFVQFVSSDVLVNSLKVWNRTSQLLSVLLVNVWMSQKVADQMTSQLANANSRFTRATRQSVARKPGAVINKPIQLAMSPFRSRKAIRKLHFRLSVWARQSQFALSSDVIQRSHLQCATVGISREPHERIILLLKARRRHGTVSGIHHRLIRKCVHHLANAAS